MKFLIKIFGPIVHVILDAAEFVLDLLDNENAGYALLFLGLAGIAITLGFFLLKILMLNIPIIAKVFIASFAVLLVGLLMVGDIDDR